MGAVKKDQDKKQKEIQKVYCGPSLPGLPQFAVLKGIPKAIELYIKEYPAISKLIVEINQLNFTRLKLAQKGSYQQKMYLEIQNQFKGVK